MSEHIKYFHELTDEELNTVLENAEKITWGECARKYPQPEWCSYPKAVHGFSGCWSLMRISRAKNVIRSIDDCKYCELLIST